MAKDAVFTMKLEEQLRSDFFQEVALEDRPASQVLRELMRQYIEERRQVREYNEFLRQKVETSRRSVATSSGYSHEDIEASFASRRAQNAPTR